MKGRLVFFLLVAACTFIAATPTAQAVSTSDVYVHYTLDETTGTTFGDSGMYNNDATYYRALKLNELPAIDVSNITVPTTSSPAPPFGAAIGLGTRAIVTGETTTDHQVMVNIPTTGTAAANLPGTGDSFAVSFWYNTTNWDMTGLLASYNVNGLKWTIGPHTQGTGHMLVQSLDADLFGNRNYAVVTGGVLTSDAWAHFVVQFEGTSGVTHMYVNGTDVADTGYDNGWRGNERENFVLGARVSDSETYTVPQSTNPRMDDFAIIDGVVNQTDVTSLYTSGASSLGTRRLAHYTFDGTTGSTIADSSANGNAGSLLGYDPVSAGPAVRDVVPAARTGQFGNGVEFAVSGSETARMASGAHMPAVGDAFTVLFWVKPDDFRTDLGWDYSGMIASWNYNGLGFSAGPNNAGDGSFIVWAKDTDDSKYGIVLGPSGLNLSKDAYHHFAITVDNAGTVTGIYVDGNYVAAATTDSGYTITDPDTGVLGARLSSGAPISMIDAFLDDFAVIKGQLTATEIQQAMATGVATLYPPYVPPNIPGDANNSGTVDEADAAILAQNWGASGTNIGRSQGDFNGDQTVNAADASILAANWGATASEGTAVPEPGTLVLLALGLASCVVGRRR